MSKVYCRDVLRVYDGRISVGKDIDKVWKNPRTAFLRCLPSQEGHTQPPLLFAVKMQPCVFEASAPRDSRSLQGASYTGTLYLACPRRKVTLFALIAQAQETALITEGAVATLPNSGSQRSAGQTGLSKESSLRTAMLTLFLHSTKIVLIINFNISVLKLQQGLFSTYH